MHAHCSVWGCNKVRTGGLWFQNERLLHTSCLELLAGAFAVKCFTKNWICLQVRLRMGNTIAIACKNKPGRDPLLSIVQSSCRSWELYTREGHASRFRTFSREMEYPSRSGVETPTNGVCSSLQNLQFQLGTNWLNTSTKHEESLHDFLNTQHNFQPHILQNYFFA